MWGNRLVQKKNQKGKGNRMDINTNNSIFIWFKWTIRNDYKTCKFLTLKRSTITI